MKVLHLSTHTTGGAGIACLRLDRALKLSGVESNVMVRNNAHNNHVPEIWNELSDIQKVKKLAEQKLYDAKYARLSKIVKKVDELFTPFTSIWDITTTKMYQEADLIHLHWIAGFVDIASFFEKCEKPIVWTLHDYAPFNNGLHYPNANQDEYAEFANINNSIMELALKHQQLTIITPSKYLMNQSLKSMHFNSFDHHHIVNPIDETKYYFSEKQYAKNALDIPLDKKILVFVADELSYTRKGYAKLMEAINELNSVDLFCLVVGNNNGDSLKEFEQIKYMGHVTDENQMRLIYSAGDLLAMPSLDDNLPNIIVEGLCCGTPVVAFGTGGITEMITNKVNGLLASDNTSAELAEEISEGLELDWDNKAISEQALKKYSALNIAEQYNKIYSKLLAV
jgi:glycosyltransferase involved in cell wall biosynthesis